MIEVTTRGYFIDYSDVVNDYANDVYDYDSDYDYDYRF